MRELEAIDRTQRTLDLPAAERLRALAPDAGEALACKVNLPSCNS